LGVRGAAIGTCVGWMLESVLLLILAYVLSTPLAGNPLTFFHFNRPFALNVLRTSMPAAINEVVWSFGITTYNAVYARIGTDAIAAIQINATVEELVFVLFIGLGNACSVMVGNKIGEKDKETAFEYSRRFAILGVILSLLGGAVVFFVRGPVAGLYHLSPSATQNLMNIMLVYSLSAWLRVFNFMLFIGALRAGVQVGRALRALAEGGDFGRDQGAAGGAADHLTIARHVDGLRTVLGDASRPGRCSGLRRRSRLRLGRALAVVVLVAALAVLAVAHRPSV